MIAAATPPAHVMSAPLVRALPDCAGRPQAAPTNIVLTCADAGITVSNVRWTGWGAPFAAGLGTAAVNDCLPSCVAGHVHTYRIVVIAQGRQTCRAGVPAYARITYAWIGRRPSKPLDPNPTIPLRCR